MVGTSFGRVKAMVDDKGRPVQAAGPSTPVRMLGLRSVPTSGQEMISVSTEARAKTIADRRTKVQELRKQLLQQDQDLATAGGAAIDSAATAQGVGEAGVVVPVVKPMGVNVILKADGVGTLQALQTVVAGVAARTKEVVVQIVSGSVGASTVFSLFHLLMSAVMNM